MISKLKHEGIEVLDVFYCPHGKHEGCNCIKPKIGMIEKALHKHPKIKLEESFMIGDLPVDIELAINMGIRGFGIGIGSNYKKENIYQLNTITDLPSFI
jgi:D-glycero-D-manno-heptose 1,7-bisphosphate phosphatase